MYVHTLAGLGGPTAFLGFLIDGVPQLNERETNRLWNMLMIVRGYHKKSIYVNWMSMGGGGFASLCQWAFELVVWNPDSGRECNSTDVSGSFLQMAKEISGW